jgi:hypothetical protein
VSVIGDLPSGLPRLSLPVLDPVKLRELEPGALAIVLVGYAEALGGQRLQQCKAAVFLTLASTAFGQIEPFLSSNTVKIIVLTDMSSLYADIGGRARSRRRE